MWRSWTVVDGCTDKFSETFLETAYGREMNIQLVLTFLLHSPSELVAPVAVLWDKSAHFKVAFYCGQPETHLCNNHAVR